MVMPWSLVMVTVGVLMLVSDVAGIEVLMLALEAVGAAEGLVLALTLASETAGTAEVLAPASDAAGPAEVLMLSSGESIEVALYELASLNRASESEISDWAS